MTYESSTKFPRRTDNVLLTDTYCGVLYVELADTRNYPTDRHT